MAHIIGFFALFINIGLCFQNFASTSFDFLNIARAPNNLGDNLDYNVLNDFDFNGDGIKDTVRCTLQNFVSITDGKTNQSIFSWEGPLGTRTLDSDAVHTRAFSGCDIVKINASTPIIILANYWNTPVWRAGSPQYVVFKTGNRFVVRELTVAGFGTYYGVARSIKCSPYPQALVNLGYKDGSLCFIAEYTAAYLSRSALLKLELSADGASILAKDLTPSSDLMWENGVAGTSIWGFPVGYGFASNQRDGAFMMDSAFVDFDQDGLVDFMSAGQHAKLRAHRLVFDKARPEGVRFLTQNLTNADIRTDMTEFLKITSFDRQEPNLDVPCVYLSGERTRSGNGFDQIRCYNRGVWTKYPLPMDFFSEYYNARIKLSAKGDAIIIKTRRQVPDGTFVDLTFVVRP